MHWRSVGVVGEDRIYKTYVHYMKIYFRKIRDLSLVSKVETITNRKDRTNVTKWPTNNIQ